jgi:hypothetical protein
VRAGDQRDASIIGDRARALATEAPAPYDRF